MLTKSEISKLFFKLNEKLSASGINGEIGIVGDAVMCLVFNAREATKDIDGIFIPTDQIRSMIKKIAKETGIREDWLNDGAKGYMTNFS